MKLIKKILTLSLLAILPISGLTPIAQAFPTYDVTFDIQGHGVQPEPVIGVSTIAFASLPAQNTDGVFTFSGWSTTSNGAVLTGDYTPVANSTLYAIWQDNTPPAPTGFTITFDNQGHGTMPSNMTNITELVLADMPTMSNDGHFTFLGWATTPTGPTTTEFIPEGDSTLYAIWQDTTPAPVVHTITYDLGTHGTGTVPTQEPVTDGTSFNFALAPTSDDANFAFVGWWEAATSATWTAGDSYMPTTDMILVANWQDNTPVDPCLLDGTAFGCPGYFPPATYTVSFDNNGHGVAVDPVTNVSMIAYGALPAQINDDTSTFQGWSTTNDATGILSGDYTPTADSTLTAIWVVTAPVTYTVSFDTQGHGTGVDNITNVSSITFSSLPTSTDSAWTLLGWSETVGGETISTDYTPVADSTLYAIWVANPAPTTFTVTFDNNGHGVAVNPATGVSTLAFGDLPAQQNDGYFTFSGWSTTNDATGILSADYIPSADSTLTAIWVDTTPSIPVTYTINFNKNGHGTDQAAATGVTTLLFTSLPSMGNDGYFTFTGWSATSNGVVLTTDFTPSADSTLYAIWVDNTPAPTPPSGGGYVAPVNPPAPTQSSTIASYSASKGSVNGGDKLVVNGNFTSNISNISIDGVNLDPSAWVQTGSTITITMPAHVAGTVSIQIYNGQSPLLATGSYTYEAVVIENPVVPTTPVIPEEPKTPEVPATPNTPDVPVVTPEVPVVIDSTPKGPLAKPLAIKVYFDLGSSLVKGNNLTELKALAKKVKGLGGKITIEIMGYAQPTKGTEKSDLVLASNRAKSVAKILKGLGVDTKIVYTGMGRAVSNNAKSRYVAINIKNA
jgi:outer membrane protein OmpA-like peptidoglycan-associated protein